MTRYWTFKDYIGSNGNNAIHAWLNGLPKQAKVKINIVISRLELMERLDVRHVKFLKGACLGLMELRIPCDKVQYRPLCWYGPGDKEITLLIGAIEKGGRLEPRSACSTALLHKARITEKGRVHDHDFS